MRSMLIPMALATLVLAWTSTAGATSPGDRHPVLGDEQEQEKADTGGTDPPVGDDEPECE